MPGRRRHHVVVCGPGPVAKTIIEEWTRRNESVVAIGRDPSGLDADACNAVGVELIAGDPTDPRTLESAGVASAKVLVASCPADDSNVRDGRHSAASPLIAIAQVLEVARRHDLERALAQAPRPHRLEFRPLSIPASAARALLLRHPPDASVDVAGGQIPSVVILGFGALGEALALQAVQLSASGLVLTVLDRDASARGVSLLRRCPGLAEVCRATFLDVDPEALAGTNGLDRLPAHQAPSAIYVCFEDDEQNLRILRALRGWLARRASWDPPVYVSISRPKELDPGRVAEDRVVLFGDLAETCSVEMLLDEKLDVLARSVHAFHVEGIEGEGGDAAARPGGAPWSELPETYREASRRQADHIDVKLRAIGSRPVPRGSAPPFFFSEDEVELLARLEHARWMAERVVDGWRYGPVRDDARRIHDLLVPWEQLAENARERDRIAVRAIPTLLERVGRTIARDLVVGVVGRSSARLSARSWRNLLQPQIQTIVRRFPDRRLVATTALTDPAARAAAQVILEQPQAGLVVPRVVPLADIARSLGENENREAFWQLVACAERCFALGAPEDGAEMPAPRDSLDPVREARLCAFLAERSDVLITAGAGFEAIPAGSLPAGRHPGRPAECLRIDLDPAAHTASWQVRS